MNKEVQKRFFYKLGQPKKRKHLIKQLQKNIKLTQRGHVRQALDNLYEGKDQLLTMLAVDLLSKHAYTDNQDGKSKQCHEVSTIILNANQSMTREKLSSQQIKTREQDIINYGKAMKAKHQKYVLHVLESKKPFKVTTHKVSINDCVAMMDYMINQLLKLSSK